MSPASYDRVSSGPDDPFGLVQSLEDIRGFFKPRTGIALVGRVDVSANWKSSYSGFGDVRVAFVNPNGGDAGDMPVFRSVADLPPDFDTVVIRVSPNRAADVVRECGRKGFRTVLVFTNGFAEIGAVGAAHQARLSEAAVEAGVRLIGPNTPTGVLEDLPLPVNHRGGLIGLITQSGANGRVLVQGISLGVAYGRWVATGNEVDLEAADFMNYFAFADGITVISMYVEGFKSIARLRAALENTNAQGKPVIILKMGRLNGAQRPLRRTRAISLEPMRPLQVCSINMASRGCTISMPCSKPPTCSPSCHRAPARAVRSIPIPAARRH